MLLKTSFKLWTIASGIHFLASCHLNSKILPSEFPMALTRRAKSRSPPSEALRFPFEGVGPGATMLSSPSEWRERENERVMEAEK